MGLLDDVEQILDDRALRAARKKAEEEAPQQPWWSDWTQELAVLLTDKNIPMIPIYFELSTNQGAKVSPVSYFGDAWPLVGRKEVDFEVANSSGTIPVLLRGDGSLWSGHGILSRMEKARLYAVRGEVWRGGPYGGKMEFDYPGVLLEHVDRFMLLYSRPEPASNSPAGDDSSTPKLRRHVGLAVVAALIAGEQPRSGWLHGQLI